MTTENLTAAQHLLPVSDIYVSPMNPKGRTKDVAQLAESIRGLNESHPESGGLVNPITVRQTPKGYEIGGGARRFTAYKQVHGKDAVIPAIIRNLNDEELLAVILAENDAGIRVNVDPYDEARKVHALHKKAGSLKEVSAILGRSEQWVKRRSLAGKVLGIGEKKLKDNYSFRIPPQLHECSTEDIEDDIKLLELIGSNPDEAKACSADTWSMEYSDLETWLSNKKPDLSMPWSKVDLVTENKAIKCAKACAGCPLIQKKDAMLFPELVTDAGSCDERACYAAKFEAYVLSLINGFDGKVVVISSSMELEGHEVIPRKPYHSHWTLQHEWTKKKLKASTAMMINADAGTVEYNVVKKEEAEDEAPAVGTTDYKGLKRGEMDAKQKANQDADRFHRTMGKILVEVRHRVVKDIVNYKLEAFLERISAEGVVQLAWYAGRSRASHSWEKNIDTLPLDGGPGTVPWKFGRTKYIAYMVGEKMVHGSLSSHLGTVKPTMMDEMFWTIKEDMEPEIPSDCGGIAQLSENWDRMLKAMPKRNPFTLFEVDVEKHITEVQKEIPFPKSCKTDEGEAWNDMDFQEVRECIAKKKIVK